MKNIRTGLFIVLSSFVLIGLVNSSAIAQSVNSGAANLNDLQSQGAGGSVQNNGLNQDVGNISNGGASGANDLLKGESKQDDLKVTSGPSANESAQTKNTKAGPGWLVIGSLITLVLLVPLVYILVTSRNSKVKPAKETENKELKTEKPEEVIIVQETKVEEEPVKEPKPTKSKSKKSKNNSKVKRKKKKR